MPISFFSVAPPLRGQWTNHWWDWQAEDNYFAPPCLRAHDFDPLALYLGAMPGYEGTGNAAHNLFDELRHRMSLLIGKRAWSGQGEERRLPAAVFHSTFPRDGYLLDEDRDIKMKFSGCMICKWMGRPSTTVGACTWERTANVQPPYRADTNAFARMSVFCRVLEEWWRMF